MKPFDVYPLNPVTIVKAEGSWVWDEQEVKYLDFYGGHAVISIGHSNRRYIEAIEHQLSLMGFYSNSVRIPLQEELAERLGRLCRCEEYALFMVNSGAEANENALKLASFHTGRRKVVSCSKAFHGRTSLTVRATDNPSIVAPINESDNVIFSPYNDIEALERNFDEHGHEIACVIVEAIQGVGGIIVASDKFMRAIRSLCDKYGAVMIADEIQCGCGRSGRYFAMDHTGMKADIYSMAKGIGNGFPIGAIAIAPHIKPRHGMLGTTFGGNQLACAAALAVAETMEDERLVDNAVEMGSYLMAELGKLPGLKEIRGRGLMIGIDMGCDSTMLRRRLLLDEHIFVGSTGTNVIRLLPALNITREHCDIFLGSFKKLLTTC